MSLKHDFSERLKAKMKKLFRKDKRRYEIIMKKMEQIVQLNESDIGHFKNLRRGLSNRKRVHIDKSFVLTFKFYREKKFILFLDFGHHDSVYKK